MALLKASVGCFSAMFVLATDNSKPKTLRNYVSESMRKFPLSNQHFFAAETPARSIFF